jgi:hypothetical protein
MGWNIASLIKELNQQQEREREGQKREKEKNEKAS